MNIHTLIHNNTLEVNYNKRRNGGRNADAITWNVRNSAKFKRKGHLTLRVIDIFGSFDRFFIDSVLISTV